MDNRVLVQIKNLSKTFIKSQPPVLNHIEADIEIGKIVGVIGPDGSGKTTLLRLIAGILTPTSGTISIAGCDSVKEVEKLRPLIGYMPQKFGLYEDLSVEQNLTLYADLRGITKEMRPNIFKSLLHFTGLQLFTNRLAGKLSGGMKQKLGLACALIKKPLLLLLDEPSVGVDPLSRRELWTMVYQLLKDGISIIWSTAYLDEAEKCNQVLLLNEGKLLYQGLPSQLTAQVEGKTFLIPHVSENRRKLLSQVLNMPNVLDGVIQGSSIRFVTKEKKSSPIELNLPIQSVPPRFEDAFIAILGGGPGAFSQLAALAPEVQQDGNDPVIAKELTKNFGNFTAASRISFTAKRGEIFGLLGPNGAGKSTTFKMLCGLLRPTQGKAWINGKDLQNAPAEARSHIGYMAQKFSLYGTLSVQQNMEFFAGAYNLKGNKQKKAIEKMVEVFNLKPYLSTTSETLPLGFKQRLSLACATMHHPEILFLDEPTSGVDPLTRREFWTHINGLVEKGVSVMVTTHFMDEAEYCDRIALIYESKIIYLGTPDALKKKAESPVLTNPTLEDAFISLIEECHTCV